MNAFGNYMSKSLVSLPKVLHRLCRQQVYFWSFFGPIQRGFFGAFPRQAASGEERGSMLSTASTATRAQLSPLLSENTTWRTDSFLKSPHVSPKLPQHVSKHPIAQFHQLLV